MPTLEDYRDREHWSFSALNQFVNICSLQYAFDRVYRLPKEFTPVSLSSICVPATARHDPGDALRRRGEEQDARGRAA